jgi:hypothetical protein
MLLFAMDSITAAAMTGVDTGRLRAPLILRPWGSAQRTQYRARRRTGLARVHVSGLQSMMAQALVIDCWTWDVPTEGLRLPAARLPRH